MTVIVIGLNVIIIISSLFFEGHKVAFDKMFKIRDWPNPQVCIFFSLTSIILNVSVALLSTISTFINYMD